MKMIRIIAAAMCCVTLLTACRSTTPSETISTVSSQPAVSSVPEESSNAETSSSSVPESETPPEPEPVYSGYALYCVDDHTLLDGVNVNDRVAPASLTKLITASVALRYMDADEVVTVGTELQLVEPDSSLCLISRGQRLKLYDLLTGLLLPSGNDAAYTIAVTVARKVSGEANMSDERAVQYFCMLMNDLAKDLGMKGSHFADPDGWDNDTHYTTVSDLIKIAEYALTYPEIREIVSTPEKFVVFESGESIRWFNGNKLLHTQFGYYCENAIGMKTGFTDNAGLCLVAAFVKGGKTYITVIVGCEDDEFRYNKTLELFKSIE